MPKLKQNINYKLHAFQKNIIEKLASADELRFNEIQIEGLESEHMNYHLKKLIDLDFVDKKDSGYSLSNAGKDYLNLLDDNVRMLEKQLKTSVMLHVIRVKDGKVEQLVSKRSIHPYKGKVGRLTGKVRFGEKLEDSAKRELYEETGLVADRLVLEEVYHKIRFDDEKQVVQDVLFYRFFIDKVHGNFIEFTPVQRNMWLSSKELQKMDLFDSFSPDPRTEPRDFKFVESVEKESGF